MIDNKWSFNEHIRYVERKANKMMRALNSLMPNLRGPDKKRRRLYANVVTSVILYGAPVWGDVLACNRLSRILISLERTVAQRVISAYRTVSYNAALLLARLPPWSLMAGMRKRIYDRIRAHREDGTLTKDIIKDIREDENGRLCNEWRALLERSNSLGEFTKMAVVPWMESWLQHSSGGMTFHLTQILTGHGCFAKFLFRIGKRRDPSCDMCGEEEDNVYHTLRECPAWDLERIRLKTTLGLARDFTLGDIIGNIVNSRELWIAFSSFVEKVMREKEEEERRRERLATHSPVRNFRMISIV